MKSLKHILIPVFIIAAGVTAWAVTPGIRKIFSGEVKTANTTPVVAVETYSKEEDSLFEELAGVYNKVGQLNAYMAEGNIRVTDQADTSRSMEVRFRYCHKDSLSYYQLGDQEIIAVPGVYITVNHSIRKIFMSPRETKGAAPQLFISQEHLKALKLEKYKISKETMEPLTVIRLSNNMHVSCREYRVSYDSAMFIRRIFMRTSDEADPANYALDKMMSVTINNWQTGNIPMQVFNVNRYIQQSGEDWLPATAFSDYEVKYIY